MLMSNMAMMDLGMRRRSILDRARELFRIGRGPTTAEPTWANYLVSPPKLIAVTELTKTTHHSNAENDYRWRRHPQLLRESIAAEMSDAERHARKIAVRGLYCAHNGEIDEAFLHFVHAIDEFRIDLTEMPAFWQMPRGAILAAADAYESAGRFRDAAMIQAHVRTELRPRNVVPMRASRNSVPQRRTASGD